MKKLIICGIIVVGTSLSSQAQCDKKVMLTGSKAIFVGSDGNEERVKESNISIDISKNSITISPNDGPNDQITGSFKEITCDWKEALKNGKTTSGKVDFSNAGGENKTGKFTLEAKDGVIIFWLEINEESGVRKIKVPIEKAKEE